LKKMIDLCLCSGCVILYIIFLCDMCMEKNIIFDGETAFFFLKNATTNKKIKYVLYFGVVFLI